MDEPLDEPLLLADVVQECSGLTPPKSVVSLSAQLCPDTAQIYAAWGAFTAWVAEALAEQTNVHLLDFATMSLRAYTLGIVIPTFVLSERFKRAYGLQQERTIDAAHNIAAVRHVSCSAGALAERAQMAPDAAMFAVVLACAIFHATVSEMPT